EKAPASRISPRTSDSTDVTNEGGQAVVTIKHVRAGLTLAAITVALGLGVAACGGDDSTGSSKGDEQGTAQGAPVQGRQGGKLTMLWTDDVDYIDPGQSYYQMGVMINQSTQRP